jgi:hypothetical protein
VIGDDVEDLSHIVFPQGLHKKIVVLRGADLRVYPGGVRDVVSVKAAGAGCKIGRRVDVGDAKFFQIGDHLRRVGEPEMPVELDPVGRERYPQVSKNGSFHD